MYIKTTSKLYVPTRVYVLVHVQMYTHKYKHTFSSTLGKKTEQEGTKTSKWHGGYAYHKVMCFQFFMPEVIIIETMLKQTCQC